jgi:LPPG:FO 2-phospho-L-lactate transferase
VRITVLAGGIGGAKFITGLKLARPDAHITVIGNTADDIWLFGLKICPDLDTLMYTLGGGIATEKGWGRDDESWRIKQELAEYGAEPTWFGLGDLDFATHIYRTSLLTNGLSLTQVTARLCERWQPGVELLPMTDVRVETNVVVDLPGEGVKAIHFQEWWVKHQAKYVAKSITQVGAESATPAPGVIDAIAGADLVLLPPSNPVVSIGAILSVPGIADAIKSTKAPVVGVSPIIGDAPVRGMADACLRAIGVDTTAAAVALHYGSRSNGGLIDAWLMDEVDAASANYLPAAGLKVDVGPLWMTTPATTAEIAKRALRL